MTKVGTTEQRKCKKFPGTISQGLLMKICQIAGGLLLAMISTTSNAEPPAPYPILLLYPESLEFNLGPGGQLQSAWLAGWASDRFNKSSAENIARFHTWLPEFDLNTEARNSFTCALMADPLGECRPDEFLPATEEQLKALMAKSSAKRGYIVKLQPTFIPAGLALRAPATEVELDGELLRPVRTFTALYANRVPATTEDQRDGDETRFREYWLTGTPNRLTAEAQKGLHEVASILTVLSTELGPNGQEPSEWAKLPKIKQLEKAGRARCRGTPCWEVRIYKDTPEELWLAHVPRFLGGPALPASVGSAMVSLDANAALFETSVYGWAIAGY